MKKFLSLFLLLTLIKSTTMAETDYQNNKVMAIMEDLYKSSKMINSTYCNGDYSNGLKLVECSFYPLCEYVYEYETVEGFKNALDNRIFQRILLSSNFSNPDMKNFLYELIVVNATLRYKYMSPDGEYFTIDFDYEELMDIMDSIYPDE